MSSSSTAALEYNTNGELTIKNRQNESTGNSLKFKTSTTELTTENNKLIDIKQNNNSRLSIDEIGTGAIKIERNEADPEDLKYSIIKIKSNTDSKPDSDVNQDLTVNPYGILLGTSVYSEDDSKSIHSIHSRYIDINTLNKNEGSINLQNNKYQLDSNNEFILNNQKEFINESYTKITLGMESLQMEAYKESPDPKGTSIDVGLGGISLNLSNGGQMQLNNDTNGFIVNAKSTNFTIKNNDFSISAIKDSSDPYLRFEHLTLGANPETVIDINKDNVVIIPKLSFGSDDGKNPLIMTGVAISGSTPNSEDYDNTLTTFGCVKNLIPNVNITDANKFYLLPSDADNKIFYIAFKYDTDNKVYGMKVAFDGTNTPTITGFKGKVNDKGKIEES